MSCAIRAEGLTRDFGASRALDRLDLEVPLGTIFGFLGPNGAGKTTTIRLLLGLLEPSAGRASVLDHDVLRDAEHVRAATGALLEHPGIYERMSAEKNLELFGRIQHLPAAERRARARELLGRFGLWESRGKRAGILSRGMKQKLAIARAMLHRPRLLFLDEPTAGLDPSSAASLREDLLALAAGEGVTIFLTTHNLDEAERVCDTVGIIHRGRLLAAGPPGQLRARGGRTRVQLVGTGLTEEMRLAIAARPEVEEAVLRDELLEVELRDGGRAAPLVRLLVCAGAELDEVRRITPSLEAAYLELVEAP